MAKKSYVQDESGKTTHIRYTSNDGRISTLYEVDDSITGQLLSGGKGACVEVAEHHPDGTTDAYEADNTIMGSLFHGGKGKHK